MNLKLQAVAEKDTGTLVKTAILTYLMEHGSFTIPDIVEETGISMTTISKYVFDLQTASVLEVIDTIKTSRKGRRPLLYGMKTDPWYFLGVSMRMYGVTVSLMSFTGEVLMTEDYPDFVYENSYYRLEELCALVNGFMQKSKDICAGKITAACFALGGRVNATLGTSASIFNLEETSSQTLSEILSEKIGVAVFIENDSKAMVRAEYSSLKAQGVRDVLFVNVGWGLGLGIVIDGEIYRGKDGYSGEIGHMRRYSNEIICHCGKKGCAETEVSGRAIARKLKERIIGGENSVLAPKVLSGRDLNMTDIMDAISAEDPLCLEIVTQTGSELGMILSSLINIFNPECIVIGGRLAETSSYYFLGPVENSMRKFAIRLMIQNVKVTTSRFGLSAGSVGACMTARERMTGAVIQSML